MPKAALLETLPSIASNFVLYQAEDAIANYLPQNQPWFTTSSNGAQTAIYTVREWANDIRNNLAYDQSIQSSFYALFLSLSFSFLWEARLPLPRSLHSLPTMCAMHEFA